MDAESLIEIFKNGGVVTINCHAWSVDRAHSEEDMPEALRQPLSDDEHDDEWLDRQGKWWDSLKVCDIEDTKTVLLIEALCRLANVRVRIV